MRSRSLRLVRGVNSWSSWHSSVACSRSAPACVAGHLRSEVDYPQLFQQRAGRAAWFPTVQRTVECLRKIYRVLEMPTFEGIASELGGCLRTLARTGRLKRAVRISGDGGREDGTW